MKRTILQSERLSLVPLSLHELTCIDQNEHCSLIRFMEKETVTDTVLQAVAKKIKKMRGADQEFHVWYTYWLVMDRQTEKGIGFIGFKGVPDNYGYSEVGYSMSSRYRRRGLMTESLNMLMGWAREHPACKGVMATVLKSNIGSETVVTKCGFQRTGSDERHNKYVYLF